MKTLAIVLGVIFLGMLAALILLPTKVAAPALGEGTESGVPVKLYYYDPARDQGEGGAQCSEKGLVSVERVLPQSPDILHQTIQILLRGELTEEERASGIRTEFPLEGVALKSAQQKDGIVTLTFVDPNTKLSGGSCRVAVLWKQVQATAQQFPGVTEVRFLPEDIFQP